MLRSSPGAAADQCIRWPCSGPSRPSPPAPRRRAFAHMTVRVPLQVGQLRLQPGRPFMQLPGNRELHACCGGARRPAVVREAAFDASGPAPQRPCPRRSTSDPLPLPPVCAQQHAQPSCYKCHARMRMSATPMWESMLSERPPCPSPADPHLRAAALPECSAPRLSTLPLEVRHSAPAHSAFDRGHGPMSGCARCRTPGA